MFATTCAGGATHDKLDKLADVGAIGCTNHGHGDGPAIHLTCVWIISDMIKIIFELTKQITEITKKTCHLTR